MKSRRDLRKNPALDESRFQAGVGIESNSRARSFVISGSSHAAGTKSWSSWKLRSAGRTSLADTGRGREGREHNASAIAVKTNLQKTRFYKHTRAFNFPKVTLKIDLRKTELTQRTRS